MYKIALVRGRVGHRSVSKADDVAVGLAALWWGKLAHWERLDGDADPEGGSGKIAHEPNFFFYLTSTKSN